MLKRKILRVGRVCAVIITAAISGCTTMNPDVPPKRAQQLAKRLQGIVTGCSNVLAFNVVSYDDADDFDCRVFKGLSSLASSKTGELLVKFPEESNVVVSTPPERLHPWIVRVQNNSGRIATCKTDPTQSIGEVVKVGAVIVKELWPIVKEAQLYGPAENFDLRVEVTKSNYIRQLRFIRKPSDGALFSGSDCKVGLG
jgi:hypothetical protein